MSDKKQSPIVGILGAVLIGGLVAWAGGDGGAQIGGMSVFAICGALAFAINWLAFIPANAAKTEKYYDLTGMATYLSMTLVALALSGDLDARAVIAGAMVMIWTIRLGTFLFRRISKAGRDGRFDEIKVDPVRFFRAWTLQGLWVLLTAAAALAIITTTERRALGWVAYLGIVVWLGGFVIEVIADQQKSAFKANPGNEGQFIATGLWAWSRHPNYFGEITLWIGVAILAVPILSGWQWIVLVSPVFVAILLTRGSGIPLLEARADKRWGDQVDYQEYKCSTPVLIPKPPGRS